MPEPSTHDEFGYILQANTIAHGRLTNPTHPLWRHFESFHIIQHPTYTAKYPPAQGLFLALGQVLAGRPIVGAWISFAFMMAALYWALKSFFEPGWALLGTVLAGIRMGFIGQPYLAPGFGYWSQSYWGGAVAAFGGALLFGSCRRLWEKPSVFPSLLLGAGLSILANSRPYEGLIASLPLLIALPFWFFKERRFSRRMKIFRVLLPLSAVLALTVSWMAYYNWRVTGDPFKTPYMVHEKTYGMPSIFIGQKTSPKTEFRDPVQKDYYAGYVQELYSYHSTFKGFVELTIFRIEQNWVFFFGIFLLIPLFFLRKRDLIGDPWARFFGFAIMLLVLGEFPIERLPYPHYFAPVTFPIYYFMTQGLVRLNAWRWGKDNPGRFGVCLILLLTVVEMLIPFKYRNDMPFSAWHRDRANLLQQLKTSQGQHLIIVRYSAGHSFHNEWVYNDADIDRSKVVWARELSTKENDQLSRYFSTRHRWVLEVDKRPLKLIKYAEGEPVP